MDLIYTNSAHEDVGVLHDFTLDLAFGSGENDFELKVDKNNNCCEMNAVVYIEGTEYGGIIDGMKVSTKDDVIVYNGRTWHGMLGTKIIEPDAGQSHLIVSGEANGVVASLLDRIGLSDLFVASGEDSGLVVNNYQFDRYVDAYSGIVKMLDTVSGKMKLVFMDGKVCVSVLPLVDYSQDEQFDNDTVEMEITKTHNFINHMICLGQGELTERQVIHLYADADGNVSENQTFFGVDERVEVYDYSNAKDENELKEKGTEKLAEYAKAGKVSIDFTEESDMYDIGDIVGAKEIVTGTSVTRKIEKKIVTIKKGETNIEYKVGE